MYIDSVDNVVVFSSMIDGSLKLYILIGDFTTEVSLIDSESCLNRVLPTGRVFHGYGLFVQWLLSFRTFRISATGTLTAFVENGLKGSVFDVN